MWKDKRIKIIILMLAALLNVGCGSQEAEAASALGQSTEAVAILESTEQLPMSQQPVQTLEEQDTEVYPEEEKQKVELVMVGDVLLHEKVAQSGQMPDGTWQYDHLFAQVRDEIEAADLALVNQEVILGGRELGLSGYPSFNGAYEVGDSLVNAGFDVVLHATNHALDKGRKGLLNCIHFWKEKYPQTAVLGIHETREEADTVYVTEVNGIRIAILNYTYGTNGISLPKDMPYAVDIWNEDKIRTDMQKAREAADFIVVCPHWGTEYKLQESKDQQQKAQFLADQGADLIIGTHPHVIEPVTWLQSDSGKEVLVYYSLGNFINATSGTGQGTAARMVGAMAQVTIEMDEQNRPYISSYGVEPLVTHNVSGAGQITTYRLKDYTEELAGQNEMRKQDPSFSLSYCQSICREVFGDLYQQ